MHGILFMFAIGVAVQVAFTSIELSPWKSIDSDEALRQIPTYAISDLFDVVEKFTADPDNGRILYDIASRQLQETPTADQFYTRYDNSHFFLPIPREQTIYLAGGRLSKLFPERRIVFLVAFRPELRYASIELDNIYYSHNLSSPFSWYHFDVNYVADDLQSRNDLNSRLIDLCSKNKCLGPSIDTLKLWRDKRAALMTQLQKLLMDKRVLLGTAKENLQEVEAVATAYSSVSVLFSNSAAVTLSKKTFSSAALDLSAEMGVTLRHSNMFKDLSITGDTVKQTSKLCELDGNQTATVDAAFGESWVSYYWHCPTAMSFNTSLVGSKRAVCSGQSGTFVPADLQCNQLCQPITNYKILPVTGGAHPLDYNQPATSVLTITCAPNTTLVPSLNTSVITTCSNGIWQPEVPPCEGTCPSLNILGGVVRGNLFAGPVQPSTTAVVISCLANRSIDETGNQSMELTCNGTLNKWEPYEPTCQLSCTLPVIPHSIINQTVNQFLSGTEIEILCSENHTVNGTVATETVVKCENNYWTPGLPKCLAKCDKLEIGQAELFGGIDIRDVAQLSTTTVNVTCWENFTIDGTPANNLEIQCDDGSWRPEVPRCLQICEGFCVTDSSINSGNGNCVSQQLSTAVAIVDCATHYLINNSTRPQLSLTCDNGTWSHPIPTCLPMCPSIDVNAATIAGGDNPQVDWQPFDTQLTVKCWEEGEFTLSCMDSIWNPVVPLCDVCPTDISVAIDRSIADTPEAWQKVVSVMQSFVLQLPVSSSGSLFNLISFAETAQRHNEFSQLSTPAQLVDILRQIQLAELSYGNASSALSMTDEGFNIIRGDRPCYSDLSILLIGSEKMNLSAVDVRRLNRRNIRTVAIAIGNSTSSLDPYPFDNILYLATVEAFTLEHLNSQALSRCQPCQTNFSDDNNEMVILPSEVGLAADIATTIELNSTAQTITAQTSTTTNTPIKTSSSPTATTTTTTTTKTTTDCNPSAFSCDSVDQFCLYFELCTECAKCSAPVCSCQAGWRTNVTDVTISGALQCSLDVDECEDQPCNNSGVCSNSPGSFTCRCPKEFTGVTCDYYVGCARPDVYECPPDQECKLHPVTGGIYGKCLRKNRLDVTPT